MVSFIAYSFNYTGKLNDFDWIIYWSNIVAWVLQPALFLHFVLTFPEKRQFVRERPWLLALAYVPGAVLLARHIIALRLAQASGLSALGHGPAGNGVRRRAVHRCRGGAVVQLPSAPARRSCGSN